MLLPFPAAVLDVTGPATRSEAASWSRAIRDSEAAYPVEREAADGHYRRFADGLYAYSVSSPRGPVFSGLVGVVRLADVLPHEDTVAAWALRPSPDVEIRPLLAVGTGPLPELPSVGRTVEVVYGSLIHRVTPVRSPGGGIDPGTLVLADGHHRRAAAIRDRGRDATAMTLVVGDGGAGLRAESFQRRLPGVGPLPDAVGAVFSVTRLVRVLPRVGGLVWVEPDGTGYYLRVRPEALQEIPPALRPFGAAAARHLLYPLIGIGDDDVEIFSTSLGARHSLQPGDAALLLPRIGIDHVVAAAVAGTMLPPKGSRFRPKPLRGLVIRDHGAIDSPSRATMRA